MPFIKRFLPGVVVASIVVVLSLWSNSLVNSSVVELNFMPPRHAVSAEPSSVNDTSVDYTFASTERVTSQLITSNPTSFSNRSFSWTTANAQELPNMKKLISYELENYSDSFLDAIGVRRIILVDNIVNRANQPMLGFADPLRGDIYLNTVEVVGEFSRAITAEQTLHHELAHLLAYTKYSYWFDRDSGWREFSQNHVYGVISGNSEFFPKNGFVSRYSMTSPSEDFAEVFSLMYTNHFMALLKEESKNSYSLSKKVRFVYEVISYADLAQCRATFQIFDQVCD